MQIIGLKDVFESVYLYQSVPPACLTASLSRILEIIYIH